MSREVSVALDVGPNRPYVRGKSLFVGGEKLYVRGVTYGPFGSETGRDFPNAERVARDFSVMAANGVNAVRTYTVPPSWFSTRPTSGLYVLAGLPWEQHVTFLDDRSRRRSVEGARARRFAPAAGTPQFSAIRSETNPRADSPVVGAGNRVLSSAPLLCGEGRGLRRTRDVCELSDDRVSRRVVFGLRML